MLQSQVNYWNYVETRRHNLATEGIQTQTAEASRMQAEASKMQAETGRMLVPSEQMKAEAAKTQADAATQQAIAAISNAKTNWRLSDIAQQNADTNAQNARINQQNADTNAANMRINQQNADTNAFNALVNEYNAVTNRMNEKVNEANTYINSQRLGVEQYNAETQRIVGESTAGLNTQKTETEAAITAQQQVAAEFAKPEHIAGLIQSGTSSLSNVGSTVNSISHAITSAKQNSANNSNTLWDAVKQIDQGLQKITSPFGKIANTAAKILIGD